MTREQKALKIAELEGWVLSLKSVRELTVWEHIIPTKKGIFEDDLIKLYSSFEGLMKIVERVNNNPERKHRFNMIENVWQLYESGIWHYFSKGNNLENLQDAILYYHEVKNANQN